MPHAVKKIKTTYEAFVWTGENEAELEAWGIHDAYVDSRFGSRNLRVNFWDGEEDYRDVLMSEGDALVKSSKGTTKYLPGWEYVEKFEDA
jgi:hypothetical protein